MNDVPKVRISELRENLAKFLSEVEHGAEFVVISRDRPVARLAPLPRTGGVKFGVLKGKLEIPPDFDEWPPGFLDFLDDDLEP